MKIRLLFFLLICCGCVHKPDGVKVTIALADGNRSLKISGFDKLIIADINRDSSNEVWQSLLPIYKMPADTDMKDFQTTQPGNYKVTDSIVVFTPDTAFKKGQAYFLRTYKFDENTDAWHYIRDKKKPGGLNYKDLIFSY
jgi:hypothetical protein